MKASRHLLNSFGLLGALLISSTALADYPGECRNAVQGRVPWNSAGDTRWAPQNVERLCAGGVGEEPARCFERLIRGRVSWGGGTNWEWENAVNLCHGARDANATISCFEGKVRSGMQWQSAIPGCAGIGPAVDPFTACRTAVEGRIPWNAQGDTRWAPANVERLCRGGAGDEPARCFEKLMRGHVSWGGGTNWEWDNASSLCRASQDHRATINCFEGQVRQGTNWQQAISICNPGQGSVPIQPVQQPVQQPIMNNDPYVDCRNVVEGRIAWNQQGDKHWAQANIERLCRNGVGEEPARCFERLMRGDINWGGSTKWEWENAVALCSGARNHKQTVECFIHRQQAGVQWQEAIRICNSGASGMVAEPDPFLQCRNVVEGRIAWNQQGDKHWAQANIERLCRNGVGDEPARCFERIMRGDINWGGGTKWEWENAVSLCGGSQANKQTVECFIHKQRAGMAWQQAIKICGRGN